MEWMLSDRYELCLCNDIDTLYHKVCDFYPDLILLDMHIPNKEDSIDFIRRLKTSNQLSQIPVIFVTGDGDTINIEDCFIAGAIDYIHKPFTREYLLAKVAAMARLGKVNNSIKQYLDKTYA
jgi:DNA-binding response OmpR family regulator